MLGRLLRRSRKAQQRILVNDVDGLSTLGITTRDDVGKLRPTPFFESYRQRILGDGVGAAS